MILKTIATTALAGVLILAPAAGAYAATYPATDSTLTCSVSTVPTGTAYTCTVTGPVGETATLTVDGVAQTPKVIDSTGKAVFSLTSASTAGTANISATVTNTDGTDTTTVAITAADSLAETGADNMGLALGAGALLVVGAGTVVVAARRRSSQNA